MKTPAKQLLAGIVLAIIGAAAPSWADSAPLPITDGKNMVSGGHTVDAFAGGFNHGQTLEIPAFGDVTPGLALSYESSGKNGLVGVGWALSGASFIERKGRLRGTPVYDGTDVFFLDGAELMPCTSLGGTHCTKLQNFSRIQFDTTNNEWLVTHRNGTKRVYSVKQGLGTNNTWRWYLKTETDANGNKATYNYWWDGAGNPFLNKITYGDVQVNLYWESRVDSLRLAMGGDLANIDYRLKSVDVRVGGGLLSAYKLTYTTSAGQSLLASLQKFGANATVDSSGTVTGGTAMPAVTFTYQGQAGGSFTTNSAWKGGATKWGGTCQNYGAQSDILIDMNGDGLLDHVNVTNGKCLMFWSSGEMRVRLNTGSGWGAYTTWKTCDKAWKCSPHAVYTTEYSTTSPVVRTLLDMDGDGRPDLVSADNSGRITGVERNTGSGFSAAVTWWNGKSFGVEKNFCVEGCGSDDSPVYVDAITAEFRDMNGDGLPDYVFAADFGTSMKMNLNTGSGWSSDITLVSGCSLWSSSSPLWHCHPRSSRSALIDMNGDGLPDRVLGARFDKVYLNTGGAFASTHVTWWGGKPLSQDTCWSHGDETECAQGVMVRDMNGDGMADHVQVGGYFSTGANLSLNTGRGWAASTQLNYSCYQISCAPEYNEMQWVDINGDGLLDRCDGVIGTAYLRSATYGANLLTAVKNELGGTTTVSYKPSTAWNNTLLPHIMPTVNRVTASDGRGGSVITDHWYEGGLWSRPEARFLGFRKARVFDATGAFTEHIFTQNVSDPASTPEMLYKKDAAGLVYDYGTFVYARSGNGATSPYISRVSEKWNYSCNGDASCKQTLTTYAYHGTYGMLTRKHEHGDTSVSGDERTTRWTYSYPNATDYLVSHVYGEYVYRGISTATADMLRRIWNSYDSRGNVTRFRDHLDPVNNTGYVDTKFTYDTRGNRTSVEDPLGNRTLFTYDGMNRVLSETNALNHTVQYAYDPLGRLQTVTDANGQATSFQYDALSRQTRVNKPLGNWTDVTFNSIGNPTSQYVRTQVSDSGTTGGIWTRIYVDGMGRPYIVLKEGFDGAWANRSETRKEYDARGLLASESAPYFPGQGQTPHYTVFDYDAIGRLTRKTHPDGAYTHTVYGAGNEDWKVQQYNELNNRTVKWLDAYGRVVHTREFIDGSQSQTYTTYDLLGNLVLITDSSGNQSMMEYDALGRKVVMVDPDMGTWTYQFDKAGNLTRQTDARGFRTDLYYDAINRLQFKHKGNGDLLANFLYDEARSGFFNKGRMTTAVGEGNVVYLNYDANGRLLRKQANVGNSSYQVNWTYNIAGDISSIKYPSGQTVAYKYDNAGRLTSAGTYVTGASYDAAGRLLSMSLGNSGTVVQQFDAARGWITKKEVYKPVSGVWDRMTFGYDAAGRMTAKQSNVRTSDSWLYSYDSIGRLTHADNLGNNAFDQEFRYSRIGNMTYQRTGASELSYSYNSSLAPAHAPRSVSGVILYYDANGNRTSYGSNTYAYNHENRLSSVNGVSYAYDALGERIQAGNRVLIGKLHTAEPGAAYDYIFFGGTRVARRDSAGTVLYYAGDHQDSARVVLDAVGDRRSQMTVLPFGKRVNMSGSPASEFGLAGERIDDGLYHMGARFLDPELGQFTQPDPSGYESGKNPQSLNRFSYVYNNPVNLIDPSGYQAVSEENNGESEPDRDDMIEQADYVRPGTVTDEQIEELVAKHADTMHIYAAGSRGRYKSAAVGHAIDHQGFRGQGIVVGNSVSTCRAWAAEPNKLQAETIARIAAAATAAGKTVVGHGFSNGASGLAGAARLGARFEEIHLVAPNISASNLNGLIAATSAVSSSTLSMNRGDKALALSLQNKHTTYMIAAAAGMQGQVGDTREHSFASGRVVDLQKAAAERQHPVGAVSSGYPVR